MASLRVVASRGGVIHILCNIFGDPRLSINKRTHECNGPYYVLPDWWAFGPLAGDVLAVRFAAAADGFLYDLHITELPLRQRLQSANHQCFALGPSESLALAFSSLLDIHASVDPYEHQPDEHIVQSIELYTADMRLAAATSGGSNERQSFVHADAPIFRFVFTDTAVGPLAVTARNMLVYDRATVIDGRILDDDSGDDDGHHGVFTIGITDFVLDGSGTSFTLSVFASLAAYSGTVTAEKALAFAERCSRGGAHSVVVAEARDAQSGDVPEIAPN
jgi:hypothetical protein